MLLEAVALAVDDEGVRMVKQPVEHGGGDHPVAGDVAPFGDRLVGREQGAAALVAARGELEEHVRARALAWQIAELVDSEQLRLGEDCELVRESPSACAFASAAISAVAATNNTVWPVSIAARQSAIAREMRLADAGWSKQQDILSHRR